MAGPADPLEGLLRVPPRAARTSTGPSSSTSPSSVLPASRSSPPRSASPTTLPRYAAVRGAAGACPGRCWCSWC
ncbi:hypothetical protein ACR6C2_15690 [Streptomyces sp. INA 01156]